MHFRLSFDTAIHPELVAELEKGAPYATAHLRRFRVTDDRRAADVECVDGAGEEALAKVKKHVDAMVRTFRSLGEPDEIARTARRDDGPIADAFPELERRRWVRLLGRGQAALGGGAQAVRRFVDEAVRDVGLTRFGAMEEEHPVLLEPDVVARSGYFGSFPQSVCLVSHLREDFDAIEAFRAANTEAPALTLPDPGALEPAAAVLRPAVCLPIYRALEGATVPEDGLAITTTGKAFRYESRNLGGLHRLWDFSMREIVFVGGGAAIEDRRAALIETMRSLLEAWDLEARVVAASDPFFATVRGTKALWQRARALKYEVLVDVGAESGPLAVASINFAGTRFGDAFGIRTAAGESATTACVGFGLERMVLALFAQHGFERARWPGALRSLSLGEAALG